MFVDRYGADIINEDVVIPFEKLDKVISQSKNAIIELFNDDSISCLLKSIPYVDILDNSSFDEYFRCYVGENDLEKLHVKELPCMLLVKNCKVLKVINGYFDEGDKRKLFKELSV